MQAGSGQRFKSALVVPPRLRAFRSCPSREIRPFKSSRLSFAVRVQMISMRLRVSLLLSIALLGLCLPVSAQDWEPLGPNDWNWPSVGKAYYPRLAIDANNNPVILAKDYGEDGEYHVRRWDGTKWIALGADGFFPNGSLLSNMVLDDSGNPVMAGSDPDNGDRVIVRRWNGSTWVSVGVDGFSSGVVTAVKLAKDVSGRFIVAYVDQSLDRHIVVKRWTGSAWEMIGDESFSDSDVYNVYLSLDPSGNPVVAYHPPPPGIHLTRIQRWTGAIWETLPPIDLGNVPVSYTDIAVDDGANPIVVLSNWMLGDRPVVERWNGTSWETIGPSGISVGNCSDVQIDIDIQGRPVVFYKDYDDGTYIRRWNGSSWEIVCAVDPYLSAQSPKMVLDGNGDFIIACQSWGLGWRTHVQRWNGSEWLEYGERGFSSMGAYYTSLAVSESGETIVAYADLALGNRTTVKRWDGQVWELIGSAGFSAGQASYHDIALDTASYPVVAYGDYGIGGLTVMRWNGSSWQSIGEPGFTNGTPRGLSLALTGESYPVVVYCVGTSIQDHYHTYVVRWNGSSWDELDPVPVDYTSNRVGIGLDGGGNIVVAVQQATTGGVSVWRWSGSAWIALGSFTEWITYYESLAMDENGDPVIAYRLSGENLVKRWNGNAWENLGSFGGYSVCLDVDPSGRLLAGALDGGHATVRHWNGSTWNLVGSAHFTTSFSDFIGPRWLQASANDKVVVAYTNGGMYAKAIEYTEQTVITVDDVLSFGPNPATGDDVQVTLGGLQASTLNVQAELHDMSGRLVSLQVLPVQNGQLVASMSLSPGLANGMYVASVTELGSRWSARLVVARQ